MLRKHHWLIAAAAGVLATSLVAGPAPAAQPNPSPSTFESSTRTSPTGVAGTVTLITGDKVTVTPKGKSWDVQVEPLRRIGRADDEFIRQVGPKGVTVIPASAVGLIRSGVLDKALFDVTGLIRQKLDDAHTQELPLLVKSPNTRAVSAFGRVSRQLPASRLTAVSVRKPFDLTKTAGMKIWLNGRLRANLDASVPQVGAPAAWQAGHTAAGVKVAVLDSGYDAAHPDLAGTVKGEQDFVGDGTGMADGAGHGTHVVATLAGRGVASGGKYTGVAKGADLVIGKVCDATTLCEFDDLIAGMQWAAGSGAKVVNLSLGGYPSDGTDPLSAEVNRLTAATGALFVVSAGNEGPYEEAVSSPAAADAALAVASVTKQDELSDFSSRGPRYGDYAMKPEIAAPGSDIVAARAAGTLDEHAVDEYHARLSGTSMAAPHVAGAAAILAGKHPDWTAGQLKAALMSSAKPIEAGVYGQGAGRLDLARGIDQQVTTQPAAVSFAPVRWPLTEAKDQVREVTYRNGGDESVTLDLRLDIRTKSGAPAPAGLFELSADSVTIPARGEAAVSMTVAPSKSSPDQYGGRLVATSADGKTVVQTPTGVYLEPESYDVTLNMTDRDGRPAPSDEGRGTATLLSLEDPNAQFAVVGGEPIRVRAGRYAVIGYVKTPIPGRVGPSVTAFAEPELDVHADTVASFDARQGRRISHQVDAKDARVTQGAMTLAVSSGDVVASYTAGFGPEPSAIPTTKSADHFLFSTRTQLERPLVRLSVDGVEIPVDWVPDTAQLVGTHRLEVVDAGRGRPEDLVGKELAGKLALFTLTAGEAGSFDERVDLLKRAGAAAALLYFTEDVRLSTDGTSLPALYLDDSTAGRLAGRQVTLTGNSGSPYLYELGQPEYGKIPARLEYRLPNEKLGAVQARYHAVVEGGTASSLRDFSAGRFATAQIWRNKVKLPTVRTEYYSPGVEWSSSQWFDAPDGRATQPFGTKRRSYLPGERLSVDWGKPVLGPGFGALLAERPGEIRPFQAFRDGDTIDVLLPLFTDSANHTGVAQPRSIGYADKGRTRLYADGKLVAETELPGSGVFKVPAGEAALKLTADVRRDHPAWPLATQVSAEWTFRSKTTSGPESLPLLAVRLDPKLDLFGYAPAGSRYTIPVAVDGGELRSVEVSYDDGAHWRQAELRKSAAGWTATVQHPKSGFVSLRSGAVDAKGNGVSQTTIRAYRLK